MLDVFFILKCCFDCSYLEQDVNFMVQSCSGQKMKKLTWQFVKNEQQTVLQLGWNGFKHGGYNTMLNGNILANAWQNQLGSAQSAFFHKNFRSFLREIQLATGVSLSLLQYIYNCNTRALGCFPIYHRIKSSYKSR